MAAGKTEIYGYKITKVCRMFNVTLILQLHMPSKYLSAINRFIYMNTQTMRGTKLLFGAPCAA